MIWRSALKGTFLALLIGSVGLKLWVKSAGLTEPPSHPEYGVAAFLTSQGFRVQLGSDDSSPRVINAQRSDCRLHAAVAAPAGWDATVIRQLVGPADRISFVFRGVAYPEEPTLRTAADYYWARAKRSFGIDASPGLVVAIITAPGCNLQGIAWPLAAWPTPAVFESAQPPSAVHAAEAAGSPGAR